MEGEKLKVSVGLGIAKLIKGSRRSESQRSEQIDGHKVCSQRRADHTGGGGSEVFLGLSHVGITSGSIVANHISLLLLSGTKAQALKLLLSGVGMALDTRREASFRDTVGLIVGRCFDGEGNVEGALLGGLDFTTVGDVVEDSGAGVDVG